MLGDTDICGVRTSFPDTRVSAVLAARDERPAVRARAVETIVACYWKPIYKYIRRRWGASNDDAEDLTQGFLASLLERGILVQFDPLRARFRTYLRLCLDGFVANERRAAGRLKRGEGKVLPLDFAAAEMELARHSAPAEDPEAGFEQEWVRSLFGLAVTALRERLVQDDKAVYFDLFERYDLQDAEAGSPTYADLARNFGLFVSDVTNGLAGARRHFRALVLEKLRELTANEEEFRSEARRLLGGSAV
jgi:DNA-directed RNA polymerase specialized sigma24 family protein